MANLELIVKRLEEYIKRENYKGYDPYDSLMSPLFKLPLLKSNKHIRFGFQQLFRRIPLNARKIFGVKKNINPVTLGLCIQAYTYLMNVFPEKKEFYNEEINNLSEKLIELKSSGFSGICWGYDFDWEARYFSLKAGAPTIVATGFITNALFENYTLIGNEKSARLVLDSVNFIKDLNKTLFKDNFCFSYSPFDKQVVFNATMKAARLLSQAYSISKDLFFKEEAGKTVSFVIQNQNPDGSWAYSAGDKREWVDNFHTCYILDSLDEYYRLTDNTDYIQSMKKGYEYYKNNFIDRDGRAKYYNNKTFPVDATSAAQTVITLSRFGDLQIAGKVLEWIIENMYDKNGYFYYRVFKNYKNKIPFMRWSNAWMLLALSYYLFKKSDY